MKEAYSFHTSQRDQEKYYERCLAANQRIFSRTGIPEVISAASDSGMMGGGISHKFMLLTSAGEDSGVICKECGLKSGYIGPYNLTGGCIVLIAVGRPLRFPEGEVGNIFQSLPLNQRF